MKKGHMYLSYIWLTIFRIWLYKFLKNKSHILLLSFVFAMWPQISKVGLDSNKIWCGCYKRCTIISCIYMEALTCSFYLLNCPQISRWAKPELVQWERSSTRAARIIISRAREPAQVHTTTSFLKPIYISGT
jgi:hypothetical protein